jgi:hypothetical protein
MRRRNSRGGEQRTAAIGCRSPELLVPSPRSQRLPQILTFWEHRWCPFNESAASTPPGKGAKARPARPPLNPPGCHVRTMKITGIFHLRHSPDEVRIPALPRYPALRMRKKSKRSPPLRSMLNCLFASRRSSEVGLPDHARYPPGIWRTRPLIVALALPLTVFLCGGSLMRAAPCTLGRFTRNACSFSAFLPRRSRSQLLACRSPRTLLTSLHETDDLHRHLYQR